MDSYHPLGITNGKLQLNCNGQTKNDPEQRRSGLGFFKVVVDVYFY
jgi:hypothetical protein